MSKKRIYYQNKRYAHNVSGSASTCMRTLHVAHTSMRVYRGLIYLVTTNFEKSIQNAWYTCPLLSLNITLGLPP